jgi:hypothetical protein
MMDLAGLREELDGELLVPDSPGYEAVRRRGQPPDIVTCIPGL